MKINQLCLIGLIGISAGFMGYSTVDRVDSLDGTWIRKGDNLKVNFDRGSASIVDEGDLDFACDVSAELIYKDISKVKDNHWRCNFLVVTMGSCETNYEAGEIFIDREGHLVVICPGFKSKVYSKVKPRYEPADKQR
jgi:hypothetical protein